MVRRAGSGHVCAGGLGAAVKKVLAHFYEEVLRIRQRKLLAGNQFLRNSDIPVEKERDGVMERWETQYSSTPSLRFETHAGSRHAAELRIGLRCSYAFQSGSKSIARWMPPPQTLFVLMCSTREGA